jgi:methionyl-tRNA synthetase
MFKQLTAKGKIEVTTFDQFYAQTMERFINDIKSQLDPET